MPIVPKKRKDAPLRVLIVDDSDCDRDLYRVYLKKWDHFYLDDCDNGTEALSKVISTKPDCVLLDYNMQGYTGVEILQMLRTEKQWQHLPAVVMLTGGGDESIAVQAMKAGANDYLNKAHVSEESLRRVIETSVKNARLAQSLDRKQKLVSTIMSALPDIFFVISKDGICSECQVQDDRDLLVSPDEFLNKDIRQFLPGEVAVQLQKSLDELFSGGSPHPFEYQIKVDEVPRFFEARLLMLDSERAMIVSRNITDRVEMEFELEQQRQKSFYAAKMASLGEMAGGVAHEINNPLAIISGYAHKILNRAETGELEPNEVTDVCNRLVSVVKRASKIVQGMQEFSRETDSDPFEDVDLKSIIEHSMDYCRERYHHHKVELRVNCESEFAISCRGVQVAQVLLNLLNNALHAADKSDEKWVSVDVVEKENWTELSVTDSGPGVPKDVREKMMIPFFTTKGVGEGIGLGLSTSKGIMEDHGGHIELDEKSERTRFVLRFPKALEKKAA